MVTNSNNTNDSIVQDVEIKPTPIDQPAISTMANRIANSVDEYMNNANFSDEQKSIIRVLVCQFVMTYIREGNEMCCIAAATNIMNSADVDFLRGRDIVCLTANIIKQFVPQ